VQPDFLEALRRFGGLKGTVCPKGSSPDFFEEKIGMAGFGSLQRTSSRFRVATRLQKRDIKSRF